MTRAAGPGARWLLVVVFAVAMAWLEAATVYYLRLTVDRLDPYQANPLPLGGVLGGVELAREAATLIMLFAVGMLAGRGRRARLGYAAIAFGVWDICYYVFLRVIYGWPKTIFDWDILFLLPVPWWGPVLAPVAIAALMVVWGTLVSQPRNVGPRPSIASLLYLAGYAGVALALYVFMADSLQAVRDGRAAAIAAALPIAFNWRLFLIALTLMAAPVAWEGARSFRVTERARS